MSPKIDHGQHITSRGTKSGMVGPQPGPSSRGVS
jgi:hypothetical protein